VTLSPKAVAQTLAVAGVAALLALLVWKIAHRETTIADEIRAGQRPQAPAFSLPRLSGAGELALASLRGKAVVLNFWQSVCPPCEAEAPAFQRAWRRYRHDGVVFVGVDFWDLRGDARRFTQRYGISYPNVYDGPGALLQPYGVTGAPETFFIDRRGRVVDHHVGQLSHGELTQRVEETLAG
jgi:cytochrome c biogenesis protein CcmG, thiol:disulfide interchange protein DsbE